MLQAIDGPLVVALCAANRSGTRRNPLPADVRERQLRAVRPDVRIARVPDLKDDERWAVAVRAVAPDAQLVTGNRDVSVRLPEARVIEVVGRTPADVLDDIAAGRPWQEHVPPAVAAILTAHLDAIGAPSLVNADGELAHHRDFDSYGAQMDAALVQKLDDLVPWVVPGCVVDKGCGTGRLLVELSRQFPASAFVGVDLSREFLRRCDENTYFSEDVALHSGDACDPSVPAGTASTVILSSIVHEIWTYSGYSRAAVERALRSALHDLAPGGRLLVRDGVSPGRQTWRMRFLRPDVRAWFVRFAAEFKHGEGAAHEWTSPDEVRLSAHAANEFLCKKDYQKNWHIEVNEEFGTFSVPEWRALMTEAGFLVREARSYVNAWIATERYAGSVALFGAEGEALAWPATNLVVVGERPRG